MGSTHLGRWVEGGLELYEKNQFEQAKERKPVSRVPLSTLLQAYAEYTGMRLLVSLDPVLSSFSGNKWVECRCGVHLPVKMTDKRHLKENRRAFQNRDSSCSVPAKRLTLCGHESLLAPEH